MRDKAGAKAWRTPFFIMRVDRTRIPVALRAQSRAVEQDKAQPTKVAQSLQREDANAMRGSQEIQA